ncbi:hypothetical protein [Modestobacter excelsi]|uniref:hypothetical protein n=1 Tax=Modestobacter excelsi TaxID=2213161 RepID=UPI00110CED54|nr:hypothetical protein [Modestobacter excelsi]
MAVLVIVVVVLSGALGLLAHHRLARRAGTESQHTAEGIPLTDLLAPVRILVALVLAFVLVQTFSSYEDASDAADDEAGAVATEAVAAALLPSPTGPDLVGLLRCCARAVAGPGWASLEATRATSSISSDADARVAAAVACTAAFASRGTRPSLRWTLLGVTTLIFTASLLVILDLDRPFGGVARIDPTAMRAVDEQIGTMPFGADPPCDLSGAPLGGG